MNGIKYLLDTNVIIGLLKGRHDAVAMLKGIGLDVCAYSAITRMELLGFPGITEFEQQSIVSLLGRMQRLSISLEIEDETILFKQRHRVKLPDAVIMATATVHGVELLTLDTRLGSKL